MFNVQIGTLCSSITILVVVCSCTSNNDLEGRVRDLELVVYDDCLEHLGFQERFKWLQERRHIPVGNPFEEWEYIQEHKKEWGWD